MPLPLASRLALVTGASRGIGYATARALARAGAHIIAVARTQGGLEELDDEIRKEGGTATLVPLNLTDFEGIARLGAALHERHGKLDILVGNAGVAGPSSPLGHIELKPWTDVMAINVTANFQLVRCMQPLLRQSDAGRAVFVTSGAANKATAYLGPYSASKAALEALVRVWANETASTPIRVNLFNPGPIRTRMRATVFPGEDPMTPSACSRNIAIFDGRMRYDLHLAFKRIDHVKAAKGYAGPVLVCAVYFDPIAGHIPDRMAIKYLTGLRSMEAWLAPIAGTSVLVPYRFEIPTPVGLGLLQATQFVTAAQRTRPTPTAAKGH